MSVPLNQRGDAIHHGQQGPLCSARRNIILMSKDFHRYFVLMEEVGGAPLSESMDITQVCDSSRHRILGSWHPALTMEALESDLRVGFSLASGWLRSAGQACPLGYPSLALS